MSEIMDDYKLGYKKGWEQGLKEGYHDGIFDCVSLIWDHQKTLPRRDFWDDPESPHAKKWIMINNHQRRTLDELWDKMIDLEDEDEDKLEVNNNE